MKTLIPQALMIDVRMDTIKFMVYYSNYLKNQNLLKTNWGYIDEEHTLMLMNEG